MNENHSQHPIIIVNTGSPKSCEIQDLTPYLEDFLTDKHIISIPRLIRYPLVKKIIVPKRKYASQERYKTLVALDPEKGMPLVYYTEGIVQRLSLQNQDPIVALYRYQDPRWENLPTLFKEMGCPSPLSIRLIPLFPQYTYSTTSSIFAWASRQIKKAFPKTPLYIPQPYYLSPSYIEGWGNRLKSFDKSYYFVASFHTIPISHRKLEKKDGVIPSYREQCIQTAKAIFEKRGIDHSQYEIIFQSRIKGVKKEEPLIEDRCFRWAQEGHTRVVVFAPGFICDCLETIGDIDLEVREIFLSHGGKEFHYLPSFNDSQDSINLYNEILESTHWNSLL